MRALLLLSLLLLGLAPTLPGVAWAGEEASTPAPDAATIGRDLLSTDPAVRRAAEARLLERVAAGGDLAAFLRAMTDAVAAWADRNERLMEVWLVKAVEGNAEERGEAVRLLAALGEPAIRRLALELRHRSHHVPPDAQEDQPAAPPSAEEDVPSEPGLPRIYDVRDLLAEGFSAFALHGLLQKTADAHEVKQRGGVYIVTAAQRGHDALIARLDELRHRRDAGTAPGQGDGDAGAVPPAPEPPPEGKDEPAPDAAGADEPAPQAPSPAAPEGTATSEPALADGEFVARATFIRLPPDAPLPDLWSQPADPLASAAARVRVGTLAEAAQWLDVVRRMPDARTEAPDGAGAQTLALGVPREIVRGRPLRYSQDVRRTKGGAWTIVTGTIHEGVALRLDLRPEGGQVTVGARASLTEVGQPIPVREVRPGPDATPLEVEQPQWSTTTAHATFTVPPSGGGAILALDRLADPTHERILLVVTLERR